MAVDTEIKLLVGCTYDEAQIALGEHTNGDQAALLILRDATSAIT